MVTNKSKNNVFKLISLLFLSLIFGILSVNAVVYINSCGSVNIVSNETYILNFTKIPANYNSATCLSLSQSNTIINNVIIDGENITIKNEYLGLQRFFYMTGFSSNTNFTFKNIDIDNNNDLLDMFYIISSYSDANTQSIYLQNSTFENIHSTKLKNFIYTNPYSHYSIYIYIINNKFSNVYIDSITGYPLYFYDTKECGSNCYYKVTNFGYNEIKNSYFVGDNYNYFLYERPASIYREQYYNKIDNTVLNYKNELCIGDSCTDTIITNSLFAKYNHTDIDNNNIADNDIYTGVSGAKIKIRLNNNTFIQDINEYKDLTFDPNDKNIISLRDEIIGSPIAINLYYQTLDSTFSYLDSNAKLSINLNPFANIDCHLINSINCVISNENQSNLQIGAFKGIVTVENNNKINGVSFILNKIDSLTQNGINAISNSNSNDVNNIDITNNYFYSYGNWYSNVYDNSNPIIILKGNNININDNTFVSDSDLSPEVKFVFLDIESNDYNSNTIHNNNFTTLNTNMYNSSIFGAEGSSIFYNNYVGTKTVLTETYLPALKPYSYVGFKHTDGKVYYFNIGNYYEDNIGCIDTFNTGICENNYTSGSSIDLYPLSSYPFDYTLHLNNAVDVVSSSDFNVSILTPINNSNFIINSTSSVINLGFTHNSDFSDLTCYYYINNNIIEISSPPNPKDTTITIQTIDWNSGSYNFKVTCLNNFIESTSDTINFNVTVLNILGCMDSTATNYNPLATVDDGSCTGGTGVYGCTDSTATNYNILATIDDGSCTYSTTGGTGDTGGVTDVDTGSSIFGGNLFGGDVVDTSNSIKSMFGFMETPSSVLLYIGYVFIFISIIFVVFALIMIMV